MSMKTEQGALTFIYSWLIAVVKLTHAFKETDKCAQNCGIIDSFSFKMLKINFETLWILKMTKQIWKNFITLDIFRGYSTCVADLSLSKKSMYKREYDPRVLLEKIEIGGHGEILKWISEENLCLQSYAADSNTTLMRQR